MVQLGAQKNEGNETFYSSVPPKRAWCLCTIREALNIYDIENCLLSVDNLLSGWKAAGSPSLCFVWEMMAYVFSAVVSMAKYPQTLLLVCMEFSRVAYGSLLVAHEGLDSCLWFTVPPPKRGTEQIERHEKIQSKRKLDWILQFPLLSTRKNCCRQW